MTTLQTNAQNSAGSLAEQQLHFTPPKSHRFLFLDALRGIAALFVVAFHFPNAMASSFAANGMLAVDFFFCLSGFVIAFSYESRLNETLSFKDFTAARLIRLYPIYALGSLIGLLVGILVQHFVFHGAQSWSASLYLFTLAFFLWPTRLSPLTVTDNFPLNGPAWSLFYEVFANLAYALLVKLRMARTTVLLCIVAGSLALLVNTVAHGNGLDVGPRQSDFSLGFARVAFSFFLGVLICRFYLRRLRNADATWIQRLVPVIITLALIGILNSPLSWMRTEGFRLIAIILCFPAMVYYGALARLPRSFTRLATALGELSYPLYLLHMPFVSLMRARRIAQFTATHTALVHGLVFCAVAILAYVSWQVGEHLDLPIRRALTRRYNAYKQARLTAISPKTSTPEITTAQHDEA
jgi:peptidoglycan/LPS O-acetylase OafA/YrhL